MVESLESLYGTGTRLCGKRKLKTKEIAMLLREAHLDPRISIYDYYIATEVFSILWVPIIPLETYIFYYLIGGTVGSEINRWKKVYYPNGKSGIYWKHVVIYVLPQFIIGLFCLFIGHFILRII